MNERRTPQRLLRGVVAAVAMITLLAGCLSPEQDTALNALNKDRRAYGLSTLKTNMALQNKAQAWAERLARENRLFHSNLTSGAPACWRGLGENVGYGGSIGQVQSAYMQSPKHKANITNGSYTSVGVGVATNGSRVFTVQVFMSGC